MPSNIKTEILLVVSPADESKLHSLFSTFLLVARWSYISGCFWLFAPKFGSWQGPTNHHFAKQ